MNSLPKPEIIITHESDLDGLVSGLLLRRLAQKVFGTDVPLKAFNYSYWAQYPLRELSGWISDLNFEKRIDRRNWLIIDHHRLRDQAEQAQLIHDESKSASLLCYELCKQHGIQNDRLDCLVELTNVGDLFLEDHPLFEEALDYAALVKTYQFWNLHAVIDGELEKLIDHPLLKVMRTKREVEDPIGYALCERNILEITPAVGLVQTVVGNSNLIVNKLLKDGDTRYPVLLTLSRGSNGPVSVGFRSRNGEALAYAEKLQGGGHANACGACLPKTIHHIPDAIDYLRKTLNPERQPIETSHSVSGLFDAIED